MTPKTLDPALRRKISLFEGLHVTCWPAWARRFFVLTLLPRKKLIDLPFTIRFGPYRYSGNATNLIDYHMLSRGAFEPGLARLLQDWARLNPASIFLDVGANVGVHTLALAPIVKQIVAIEPFPPVADRLEATLAVNKISNVAVERVALSDHKGIVSFLAPDSGNLGVDRVVDDTGAGDLLKLPQETGDDLLAKHSLPVGLVKIDVEGFELAVLGGLQQRLKKDRPLVVVEVLTTDKAHCQAIKDRFPPNYSFFRLKSARRTNYQTEPWTGESGDIVAIPEERASFLSR